MNIKPSRRNILKALASGAAATTLPVSLSARSIEEIDHRILIPRLDFPVDAVCKIDLWYMDVYKDNARSEIKRFTGPTEYYVTRRGNRFNLRCYAQFEDGVYVSEFTTEKQ